MKFDWCETNLNIGCGEYKYDHCEVCNIARAYQHGYETAQEDMSTGWIPCSERLPEDTARPVLISGRHKKIGIYAVDIARYNGGMWQYDGFTFPDCEVLAWIPLPKPYREDGEEE